MMTATQTNFGIELDEEFRILREQLQVAVELLILTPISCSFRRVLRVLIDCDLYRLIELYK